jgi:5-methylthioadenosine/S-adenosylhomocysteine deaminase
MKRIAFSLLPFLILAFGFVRADEGRGYVLRGTIVTPDSTIKNGAVWIVDDKIIEVGGAVHAPPRTPVVQTNSIILPGLIDLHNHLTWNLFPRWRPTQTFSNRYDWQQVPIYGIALNTPHAQLAAASGKNLGCLMNLYAEVKAITQGETSVVGSLQDQCVQGLARNLDYCSGLNDSHNCGNEKLKYEVFPLQVALRDSSDIVSKLASGALSSYIIHVAEGKPTDAAAAREFVEIAREGMLVKGVSLVHGVALNSDAFKTMAQNNVGLIWSPRSNLELYGDTTDVGAAAREKVAIALAPDWSPTGSVGMLDELVFATTWNADRTHNVFTAVQLVQMTTTVPAALAGLSDKIGSLQPGYYADVLVLDPLEADPMDSITHSTAASVKLVIINGVPVYGESQFMKKLLPRTDFDVVSICGNQKLLDLKGAVAAKGMHLGDIAEKLRAALVEWGSGLAPIAECH